MNTSTDLLQCFVEADFNDLCTDWHVAGSQNLTSQYFLNFLNFNFPGGDSASIPIAFNNTETTDFCPEEFYLDGIDLDSKLPELNVSEVDRYFIEENQFKESNSLEEPLKTRKSLSINIPPRMEQQNRIDFNIESSRLLSENEQQYPSPTLSPLSMENLKFEKQPVKKNKESCRKQKRKDRELHKLIKKMKAENLQLKAAKKESVLKLDKLFPVVIDYFLSASSDDLCQKLWVAVKEILRYRPGYQREIVLSVFQKLTEEVQAKSSPGKIRAVVRDMLVELGFFL